MSVLLLLLQHQVTAFRLAHAMSMLVMQPLVLMSTCCTSEIPYMSPMYAVPHALAEIAATDGLPQPWHSLGHDPHPITAL